MAKSKKSSKKSTSASVGNSVLAQAKAAAKSALKTEDWHVALDNHQLKESVPHLRTGCLAVDQLIGGRHNKFGVPACPGIPKGRITNLYGHESSGKSTLCLEIASQTIKEGGTVLYIDFENEIIPSYAKSLGIPVEDENKFQLVQPDTLEQGLKIAWVYASAGVNLIVIDSVGAAVPQDTLDKSVKEMAGNNQLGLLARKWSAFLPQLRQRCQKTGTTLIGISQTRAAINTGGYGADQVTVQGGTAWKFYSALRLRLRKIKTEKANIHSSMSNKVEETTSGIVVKAKLDKCKVADTQGNEQVFYIRFGEGIDNVRTLIEVGVAYGVISKSGSWMEWNRPDGESVKLQGTDKLRTYLMKDSSALQMLEDQVMPFMRASTKKIEEPEEPEELFEGASDLAAELAAFDDVQPSASASS